MREDPPHRSVVAADSAERSECFPDSAGADRGQGADRPAGAPAPDRVAPAVSVVADLAASVDLADLAAVILNKRILWIKKTPKNLWMLSKSSMRVRLRK